MMGKGIEGNEDNREGKWKESWKWSGYCVGKWSEKV